MASLAGGPGVPAFSIQGVLFCGMLLFDDYFVFPGLGKQGMLALRWAGVAVGIYAGAVRSVPVWTLALFMMRANMFTLWTMVIVATAGTMRESGDWVARKWKGTGKEKKM